MQKLVCTQCGAPINPETFACEYCGSIFLNSQNEIKGSKSAKGKNKDSNIFVPNIGDEELNNLIKEHIRENKRSSVFLVVFNIFWIIIASNIIFLVSGPELMGRLFGIIPFVFIIIAVGTIIKNIFISPAVKYKLEYELLNNSDYNSVYEKFKQREAKKHDLSNVYVMMLIGFYRLRKFDEVRGLIISLEPKELSDLLHENIDILNIADALNIKTPKCNDANCETHFNH